MVTVPENVSENTTEPTQAQVLHAAEIIVDAFAKTDTKSYFAAFSPDASFIFHPEDRRLNSRVAYEETWNSWLADGWSVVACASSNQLVQTFPGGAVFSHTVDTTVSTTDGQESYRERESIVFRHLGDGELMAIHEHLSTVPEPEPDADETDSDTSESTIAEAVAQ